MTSSCKVTAKYTFMSDIFKWYFNFFTNKCRYNFSVNRVIMFAETRNLLFLQEKGCVYCDFNQVLFIN